MPKVKKIILGYSVLNEYRKCPQKFAFRYLHELERPHKDFALLDKGSPLEFGTFIHEFMERIYAKESGKAVVKDVLLKAAQTNLVKVPERKLRSVKHLEDLMESYLKHYPDLFEKFQVYEHEGKAMLEFEYDFLLTPPGTTPEIVWRQHFDGVLKDKHGILKMFEHKTCSGNLAFELINRMLPNDQPVGYVYGARHMGLDVSRVLFNGLCTQQTTLKAFMSKDYRDAYVKRYKKIPAPLFMQHEIHIEDWMLEEWRENVLKDSLRLIEDIESLTFSKSAPDACQAFNSRCKYAEICLTHPEARGVAAVFDFITEPWKGWEIEWDA